tara:strand:- start:932 stop:1141 length:210 start_codon:yes stop_codon:yes gene_type:complete
MTMIVLYPTKKALKDSIGEPLKYQETSMFGNEYRADGSFSGCNRPHLTGFKREFFARITMADGKISRVE